MHMKALQKQPWPVLVRQGAGCTLCPWGRLLGAGARRLAVHMAHGARTALSGSEKLSDTRAWTQKTWREPVILQKYKVACALYYHLDDTV